MVRKALPVVLQVGISALLVGLLLRSFDWAQFRALWERTPPWFYVVSFAGIFAGQLLYGLKWKAVLDGLGGTAPAGTVVSRSLTALFFGNFLPTAVGGDVSKVYFLGGQEGYARVGASVLVDRGLSFLCLCTLTVALAGRVTLTTPLLVTVQRALLPLWAAGAAAFALAVLLPVERLPLGRLRAAAGSPWLRRLHPVASLAGQARTACRQPRVLLSVAGTVAVYMGLLSLVYKTYFRLGIGTDVDALAIFLALCIIAVLSNLPLTLNGIGLREQLHAVLFAAIGVPKEASVSIALIVFFDLLLVSLVGCALWLRTRVHLPRLPLGQRLSTP